ncbi:hypothetical protein OUZ56_007985 [Daphnia magna]|uniref:Uncharacterized protein n=1 Tax=Daphnia magna TaxID=35525 RepID=A0ABR0ABL2_9CRUS|nr:hypothetical protein OUZ56_007985 [Daphnia magna]
MRRKTHQYVRTMWRAQLDRVVGTVSCCDYVLSEKCALHPSEVRFFFNIVRENESDSQIANGVSAIIIDAPVVRDFIESSALRVEKKGEQNSNDPAGAAELSKRTLNSIV